MADSVYDPVQVFLRIRPESQHVTSSSTAARGNRLSASPATSPRRDSFNSENGQRCAVQLDDKTIKITPPDLGSRKSVAAVDDKLFTFDKVFPEDCSQEDLYESVSGLVKATVGGYNTTIFAYGSTGSGKSYTMTGSGNAPGIIPRAISEIFSMIEATAMQERDVFFYVRMSYVELYNNNFRNLLEFSSKQLELKKSEEAAESGGFETDGIGFGSAPNSNMSNSSHSRGRSSSPTSRHRSDKIEVRECQSTGVFLAGPSLRIPVTTAQEAFQLIAKGNKCRAVGSTQCNDVSSRSHAILTLHVESRVPSGEYYGEGEMSATSMHAFSASSPMSTDGEGSFLGAESPSGLRINVEGNAGPPSELRLGKMHLVDLAGSERVALSGAEGDTLVETQNINLSLTAIGDVLSALSRNAMVLSQQHNQLSQSQTAFNSSQPRGKSRLTRSASFSAGSSYSASSLLSGALSSPRTPLSLVPVPYRNSKLTHLLKDSLGGNSKTIMIATIRNHEEYYQQTAVTLMYASRAKKIRNRSLVNTNVIGDTGIHAVGHEIERLKTRLQDRSVEFEHLRNTQLKDANENNALKARLQQLKDTNEEEKKQLAIQMSSIIYNQAGQQSLREDLEVSQGMMLEQQREISKLKSVLEQTKLTLTSQEQLPIEQMEKMQSVLDGWQAQAMSTQQELETVLKQAEALRIGNEAQRNELKVTKCTMSEKHKEFMLSNGELNDKFVQVQNAFSEKSEETEQLQKLLGDSHTKIDCAQLQFLESSRKAEVKIKELESDNASMLLKLETTVGTLEKQTASTIENATFRLQKKDADLAAAHDEILSLKQNLVDVESQLSVLGEKTENDLAAAHGKVASLVENLVEEKSQNSILRDEMDKLTVDDLLTIDQLTADLCTEKQERALVTVRYDQLDSTCKAQEISLSEKDLLLKKSEDYLREIDGDRLKELEKLSITVMALRKDHKSELDSLKVELASVKEHIDSQQAAHSVAVDRMQMELRGQHEELLKDMEFDHIAEGERKLQDLKHELVAAHAVDIERERSLLQEVNDKHETVMLEWNILHEREERKAIDAKEQYEEELKRLHTATVLDVSAKKEAEFLVKEKTLKEKFLHLEDALRGHHKLELIKELEDMEGHHTIDIRRIQVEAENILENSLKVQEEAFKMSLLEQEEELLAAQVVKLLKRKEEDEGSMAQFKEEFDRRMVAACDEHKFQLEFQNKKYEEEANALVLLRDERENSRDVEVDEAMQTLKSHLRSEHDSLLREGTNNQQISHEHDLFLLRAEISNQEAALEALKVIHIQESVKVSSYNETEREQLTLLMETHRQEAALRLREECEHSAIMKQEYIVLSTEKERLDASIVDLETELEEQKREFHQISSEKEALNILLLDMQDAVARRESRFDELAAKKLDLEARIDELESKIIIEVSQSLELVESKSTMNDRIVDLKNQLVDSKAESELLISIKVTSDSRINDLEEMLKLDEAASLILTRDATIIKGSYEVLMAEKMASDDHIIVLENQAETNKAQINELAKSNAKSDSHVIELEDAIMRERVLSKSIEAQSAILQKNYDDLLAAGNVTDDRIVSLNCQIAMDKKQSDDLAERKALCDGEISDLKNHLVDEKASSLIFHEQIAALNVTLDEMLVDGKVSKDLITVLESEAVRLDEAKSELDSRVIELEGQISKDKVSSLTLEDQSASLQKSFDDLTVGKVSSDLRITELMDQLEAGKIQVSAVEMNLKDTEDRVAELEGRAVNENAKSLIIQDESTSLQKSLDDLTAEKTTSDGRIAELVSKAEANEIQLSGLEMKSNTAERRVIELEARVMQEISRSSALCTHSEALQETCEEQITAKKISDDRASDLDSQLEELKRQSCELAASKAACDGLITELNGQLIDGKAALVATEELIASQKQTLDIMITDGADNDGRLSFLVNEAKEHASQLNTLIEVKTNLDSRVIELEGEKILREAEWATNQEQSAASKKIIDEMEAEKIESQVTIEAQIGALRNIQSELVDAKKVADDLVYDLESRIATDKQQSDDLAERKALCDGEISDLKNHLVDEKASSLILHEQIAALNVTLDEMVVDGKVSKDLITVLESEAVRLDEAKSEELIEMKRAFDSRVVELEGQISRDKVSSLMLEDQSASLQKSFDDLTVGQVSSDGRITELMDQLEAQKINSDKLAVESASELDIALSSLSESQQALEQAMQRGDVLHERQNEILKSLQGDLLDQQTKYEILLEENIASMHEKRLEALRGQQAEHDKVVETLNVRNGSDASKQLEDLERELKMKHDTHLKTIEDTQQNEMHDLMKVQQEHFEAASARAISGLQSGHVLETKLALWTAAGEQHLSSSSTFREIIEKLGKEGRKAMETLRVLMEKERELDVERSRKETQELKLEYENAAAAMIKENEKSVEIKMYDQKMEMESLWKKSLSEKEKSFDRSKEAAIAAQAAEGMLHASTLRAQHELILERQRDEITRLRSESLEIELSHQKALSTALENHLSELTSQRNMMEENHAIGISDLRHQLLHSKESHGVAMIAGTDRQASEMKSLQLNKEAYEIELQSSLTEKDLHHRQTIKAMTDDNEAARLRVSASNEKERARLEDDIIRLQQQHTANGLDKMKGEISWKERLVKAEAASEDRRQMDIKKTLLDSDAQHMVKLRNVQLGVDEAMENMNRQQSHEQEEMSLSLVRLRAHHESEKMAIREANNAIILVLEGRQRDEMDELNLKARRTMGELRASCEDRLQRLEQEKESSHSTVFSELTDMHTFKVDAERALHCSEITNLHKANSITLENLTIQLDNLKEDRERTVMQLQSINTSAETKVEALNYQSIIKEEEIEQLKDQLSAVTSELEGDKIQMSEHLKEISSIVVQKDEDLLALTAQVKLLDIQVQMHHEASLAATKAKTEEIERLQTTQVENIQTLHSSHEKTISDLTSSYDLKISDFSNKSDSYEVTISALKLQITGQEEERLKIREQCMLELQSHADSHKVEYAVTSEAYRLALENLQVSTATELKTIRDNHTAQVTNLQNVHHQELLVLSRSHIDQRGEEKHQHSVLVDTLHGTYASKIDKLRTEERSAQELAKQLVEQLADRCRGNEEMVQIRREAEKETMRIMSKREQEGEGEREKVRLRMIEREKEKEVAFHVQEEKRVLQRECEMLRVTLQKAEMAVAMSQIERTKEKEMEAKMAMQHEVTIAQYQEQLVLTNQINERIKEELRSLQDIGASQERSRLEVAMGSVSLVRELQASAVMDEQEREIERTKMKETIHMHVEEMDKMKEECYGLERSATIDRKDLDVLKKNTLIDKEHISALKKNICGMERHISGLKDAQLSLHRERSEADGIILSLRHSLAEIKEEMESQTFLKRSVDKGIVEVKNGDDKGVERAGQEAEGLRREISDLMRRLEDQSRRAFLVAKEKDLKGEEDMRRALAAQQDELQRGYLSLLLQQTSSAMGVIHGQEHNQKDGLISKHQSLEEANDNFINLMRTLPDAWRLKHGAGANSADSGVSIDHKLNVQNVSGINPADANIARASGDEEADRASAMVDSNYAKPQSPDFLLHSSPPHPSLPHAPVTDTPFMKAAKTKAKIIYSLPPKESEGKEIERTNATAKLRAAQFNGRPPSLQSTPTEQLLAAIGDGDVKGVKAVVKVKGEDLTSKYWRDLGSSILPLHKAINSLHHSGEVLLVIAETLCDMGCNINECDVKGCSPLHRAITLWTERGLCLPVIILLLSRGANPTVANKEGDTPLHLILRKAGVDKNSWTDKNRLSVPSFEGDREVESSSQSTTNEAKNGDFHRSNSANSTWTGEEKTGRTNSFNPVTYREGENSSENLGDREMPSTFRWVFVAEKLLTSGATWESPPCSRQGRGCKDNQLHLLLQAFPSKNPTAEETIAYRFLLSSALTSLDPTAEDFKGRNGIFVLCNRLANIPAAAHLGELPLHLSIVGAVVDALKRRGSGLGGSDRSGLTIFDIQESVPNSCLSAAKPILFQIAATAPIASNTRSPIRRNRSLDDVDRRNKIFQESAYPGEGRATTYPPSFINRCHSLDFQEKDRDTRESEREVILFLN